MGFLWFGRRKEEDHHKLKEDVRASFESVKQDVKKVGIWIHHLNDQDKKQDKQLDELFDKISEIQADINDIKSFVSFFDTRISKQVFKHRQTAVGKQTRVEHVQTPVQTVVQTAFLKHLSVMERAIVWTLANSPENMKLSYQDVATILGKDTSTIRGQINNIKQKSEDLINESLDKQGKKRYWIDDDVKEMIFSEVRNKTKNLKKR